MQSRPRTALLFLFSLCVRENNFLTLRFYYPLAGSLWNFAGRNGRKGKKPKDLTLLLLFLSRLGCVASKSTHRGATVSLRLAVSVYLVRKRRGERADILLQNSSRPLSRSLTYAIANALVLLDAVLTTPKQNWALLFLVVLEEDWKRERERKPRLLVPCPDLAGWLAACFLLIQQTMQAIPFSCSCLPPYSPAEAHFLQAIG